MEKPFLGRGVAFPLRHDEKKPGDLCTSEGEDNIRQSLWIILATAKGERMMRPDFGCEIYDLVFDTNSESTLGKISQAVREALLRWEPRIDVRDIQVISESGPEGEKIILSIDYQVRATNNAFNLVYPFYLERSPG